jgi:hypothetical protein
LRKIPPLHVLDESGDFIHLIFLCRGLARAAGNANPSLYFYYAYEPDEFGDIVT